MESRCLRTTCTRKILFQSGLTITLWPALLLWSCFRLWTWRCMLGLLTQGILVIIVAAVSVVGSVPRTGLCLYRLKQFLIANSALSLLVFSGISILAGGVLLKLATGEDSGEAIFRSYALLNNAPGSDAVDGPRDWKDRAVSNVLYLVGVITFAVIIGVVGDAIGTNVDSVRTSNGRVLESHHTVLVNWGAYTRPMLRQLEAARREGRLKGAVVLIADKDKERMDAEVIDEMSKWGGSKGMVVTRQGSPTELANMDRVAAGTAKTLIIVPSEVQESERSKVAKAKQSSSLAAALQQNVIKEQSRRANTVIAVPRNSAVDLGQKENFATYAEISPSDFVSRVLAQCTIQPGLSDVYEEILLQGKGSELYAIPLKQFSFMHGVSFGEVWRHFPRATPMGVLRRTAGGGTSLHLAAPSSFVLKEDDKLVLLAGDQKHVKPHRLPVRGSSREKLESLSTEAQGKTVLAHPRQSVLVLNWNERTPDFIEKMDVYCARGTRITLISPERPAGFDLVKTRNCQLTHVVGDPSSSESLQTLDPASYTTAVWLQSEKCTEEDDSQLLVSLLALQQAVKGHPSGAMPRLVSEVSSPAMKDLILMRSNTRKPDLLLPTELASGVLVQFALQPELNKVYSELLGSDGKEIFLSPASSYCSEGELVTCGHLYEIAKARGQVLMGLRNAKDQSLVLNPPKSMKVKLTSEDSLVVLGDCF
ncbi:hypothetical protein AB1Y20_005779 [Prymnesium parvum]|uniref:CASTOR/POLLUX/SYM8 ion channel conserved domain-containing protein n=1 Tax=Prymnesium parvum TaxID=97485 RepID=A0AB34J3Y6_PRYPA